MRLTSGFGLTAPQEALENDMSVYRKTAEQIDDASVSLLADPGVKIEHEGIHRMLLSRGARKGEAAEVVRIPKQMVAAALELCPREVVLSDQRGNAVSQMPGTAPMFWSCPGMAIWHGGKHRPFTSTDMCDVARLLDRLSNVQVVFGMAMEDVPAPTRDVVGLRNIAANSSKHVRVLCFSPKGARTVVEMKKVVPDYPWLSVGFTAHGPLRWTNLALSIFEATSGAGIPVSVNGEPMAGVSGPVTLAGSAAVGNAEILAGIVINQLLEPGRPIIYNLGLAHIFDMKTAIAVTGGPENAIFADLSATMGRFYGLPSASWVSTESVYPDPQASAEKMFGFASHWASGVDHIWGVGQLESEITFSPAQAVIDNELINYVARFRRGTSVSQDSLAVSVTRSVGIGGSFLDTEHTLSNFRNEFFMPELLFRKRRSDWLSAGRPQLVARAEEIADDLTSQPAETALDDGQLSELARLTDRALADL